MTVVGAATAFFLIILGWCLLGFFRYLFFSWRAGPFAQSPPLGGRPAAAVLGDSITYGTISYPYFKNLRWDPRTAAWDVRNGGRNQWRVQDLKARVDILMRCQPAAVIIAIGTNDVQKAYRLLNSGRGEAVQQRTEQALSVFQQDLEELIQAIRVRAGEDVSLALMEIPPLGEDYADPVMSLVKDYNKGIAAAAEKMNTALLPVYSEMQDLCFEHYERRPPLSSWTATLSVFRAVVLRYLFFLSFDQIASLGQFCLHVDSVHFNRKGGSLLEEKMAEYLKAVPTPEKYSGKTVPGAKSDGSPEGLR